ncbi:lysosomal alpha-mannosidase, partial [Biomphalaria glabrata]
MTNKDSALTESVSQDFNYYEAQQDIHRFSGAYVFIPKHPATIRVSGEKKVNLRLVKVTCVYVLRLVKVARVYALRVVKVARVYALRLVKVNMCLTSHVLSKLTCVYFLRLVKGPLVQEIHQTFSPWMSQVIRLYKGSKHAEFQWTVGPIDDSDRQGKEVISIFTTSIVNSDTFYTDSNGRELMERVKDVRDTWNYQPKDHVSGNYYPVTSRIIIRDPEKNVQFTVLPDRPQGGSSLGSGVVELMVHRKLLNDDGLGVGEALNDVGSDKEGVIYTGTYIK